jgi:hypothetical protein
MKMWQSKILGQQESQFWKKCHLDVAPIDSQRVYYGEGNGASSQRLQAM